VGIASDRVLLGVYVLAGVFYGIASLLSVARTGVGDPNAGQTENLDASPPWCWAAPACSAAAARSSAR
jgi:ABC-type glucose/galactose transport system permease subunit